MDRQIQLHVLSWNACGITHCLKQSALKGYVYQHHPDLIFIQEAFVGHPVAQWGPAPPLSGYTPYVHHARNGLITYVHSAIPHRLLRCSTHDDTTFQLLEVAVGAGTIWLCNVYAAPGRIDTAVLPTPTVRGTIYMGDFNARHPALGDFSLAPNRNGTRLEEWLRRYRLTRWDTGGATHSRGGTLDHILTHGLVASSVRCSSVPTLFSDHLALTLHYSLPAAPPHLHRRTRINIPPKYCPTYISYMSSLLPTFNLTSPDQLYSSIVTSTHAFYDRYVRRPHIKRRTDTPAWTLDHRIAQAERKAKEDGLSFQSHPSPESLQKYQSSRDELVVLQKCVLTESWHQFTSSINRQTSVSSMWRLINRVVKRKPASTLHHSPGQYAQDLINGWSRQSRARNLPQHIREALSSNEDLRTLRLMNALLKPDEEDDRPITESEIRRALTKGKASAPGDDGITYSVLRLLQEVSGNPLLRLYNVCFRQRCVPRAWTSSTIIPIPKPGTDKFRPISLTSCFSKVMERVFLNRLMFRLESKLSNRLYGFLPQRGTHHCLMELYTRLTSTSVVAFLDLKSAFDIANRDIILDQLVDFGVKGNLLGWVREYLRNRTSRVLFKGAISSVEGFELGTPQGGVLSPFLYNVLMHRLLSLLPEVPGLTITCYADDICIHAHTPEILQHFLHSFYVSSSSCGLIISPEKSRIFTLRNPRTLPAFTVGNSAIPVCTQYVYLGAPVRIPSTTPTRQRVHPIVHDLLTRLQQRLTPLRWLLNNATGVSIPVARTIYITFIRSVIDYLSPALVQLPKTTLEPLDKFQNTVMRLILGCPMSTRIVNMLSELNLPPLIERIHSNVAYFTVKCLHFPHLSPHYSQVIRTFLQLRPRIPPLQPGGRALIKTVSSQLQRLDINIPVADFFPPPPPWMLPIPTVHFTPTCKAHPPVLQKQLALDAIATVSNTIDTPHHIYTDGSVQVDGAAGCAIFSPDAVPSAEGWVGRRLPAHSSSTFCELHGVLDAVSLLCQRSLNGVVVCDSQAALHALSSTSPVCRHLVNRILTGLALAHDRSLVIKFIWIPSHVSLSHSDAVDRLAKAACVLPAHDAGPAPSLQCLKTRIRAASLLSTSISTDNQRAASVSIQHYDAFRHHRFKYRRRGLWVRKHNVVSARLRLGYRPLWQVAGLEDEPHYTSCPLCHSANSNHLHHYCLDCPTVGDLLPRGQPLLAVCQHLLQDDHLDLILTRHPQFGGCYLSMS